MGEIVSAMVVLCSLPYIAIQVRDAKRATIRTARQENNNALAKVVLDTPDLADAIAKVTAVDGQNPLREALQRNYSLSPGELELYYYYLAFVWRSIETDFLTTHDRDQVEIVVERRLMQPTFRMFIEHVGPRFSPEFIAVVDRVKARMDDARAGT